VVEHEALSSNSSANKKETYLENIGMNQMLWYIPIIPATGEAKTVGSLFQASPGQVTKRPYLKNKL
jgi:hypothetical protein